MEIIKVKETSRSKSIRANRFSEDLKTIANLIIEDANMLEANKELANLFKVEKIMSDISKLETDLYETITNMGDEQDD